MPHEPHLGNPSLRGGLEKDLRERGTLNTDNYVKILLNLYVEARRKLGKHLPIVEESIKIL